MTSYNIAVLDDYQEISKSHFDKLDSRFKVSYFKDTLPVYKDAGSKVVARLQPFEIICTMRERTPFPRGLVDALPNLKLLLTTGSRNLALDLDAFKARNIPVLGTGGRPRGPVDSTTEHIVALIMAVTRNIAQDDANVKAGGWQTTCVTAVSAKTLGLVGLGRLGANVARIMRTAFGMEIIAWSENLTQDKADEQARKQGLPVQDDNGNKTFRAVSREDLFRSSDVISVHLVLSDRSRGLITTSDLSLMKLDSFFVNTSRGPIAVEQDLLNVLQRGKIRGAALDVFDTEPLPKDSPWRSTKWGSNGSSRVLLTPHTAYVEEYCIDDWYRQQVDNINSWIEGKELQYSLV